MTCANCDALRDKVLRLERELGLRLRDGEIGAIMQAFEVGPMPARILHRLYAAGGRAVPAQTLIESASIGSESSLKTTICRLRANHPDDLIATFPGLGYGLSAPGLARVLAAIQPVELQDVRGVVL